jgi:hypothetical protein
MAMLLKGKNGNEFELGVIRETYPEVQDTGGSRWATVTFRAATADQEWEETSPVVNLFELKNLAEWLETIAQADASEGEPGKHAGEGETGTLDLLQPELTFAVTGGSGDAVTIRIGFHLDDRDEVFNVDAETDEADYVDVHVDRRSIAAAAEALRESLQDLPMQGNEKDAIFGDEESGELGGPDETLNIVDETKDYPPGAGEGEDNAGES